MMCKKCVELSDFIVQFQGEGTHNENPGPLHCLIAGCTAGEFLVISRSILGGQTVQGFPAPEVFFLHHTRNSCLLREEF